MGCVLLTDGQQRKTLAAARSLGSRGIRVLVSESTRFTPAGFSKHCDQRLVSPDPAAEPEAYFAWLQETWDKYRFDSLFPMDDHSMAVAMRYREPLTKLCHLPLPPDVGYQIASDKGLAVAAAMRAGLDCPQTVAITDLAQLTQCDLNLPFPVLIKPRHSSGSRGITIAHNRSELVAKYTAVHANYPYPIVQECMLPGPRYGVCLLFDQSSTLKASFIQRELRGFPVERGPSTLQEGIGDPGLLDKAVRLMQSLGWRGVAQVEYMQDKRDDQIKFLEINPRFWGSLYCSILAGVDFPWLLYQLLNGQEFPVNNNYRTDLRCRWLLPGDLLHWLTNPQRTAMDPPFFSGRKDRVYDDILAWDDPMPTIGFLLACLRYLPDRKMWRMIFER